MPAYLKESIQNLIAPIPGQCPTGEEPKYQSEYDLVKNEVAKTSARDFELVAKNCHILLTQHAKDMTVLGYYLLATASLQQWEMCANIAQAYAEIGKIHWELIHPQRERARMNALRWLNEERVVGSFEQAKTSATDFEHLTRLHDALNSIRSLINEKCPTDTPSIKGLLQVVEQKCKSLQPKTQTIAAPKIHPEVEQVSVPLTSVDVITPPSTEAPTRTDLLKTVQIAALQITQSDPDKALGYVLLRLNRWQDQILVPKADGQGRTAFAAPIKPRREFLANLVSQKSWDAILEKSEAAFTEPGFQFWFDLQYYTVQALRGKERATAADAIEHELHALITRLPQLVQMEFADGTPFAAEDTREWLAQSQSANQSNREPAKITSKAQRTQTLAEDLIVAQELGAKGKWMESLAIVQSGLLHGNLRERTERSYALADLALQASKYRIAYHIAQELCQRVESRDLVTWDPELAKDIWKIAHKASKALANSEPKAPDIAIIQSLQSQTLAHSCMADPAYAAQIS